MSQDPLDLERTDEKPKSHYLSKRDIRVFLIAFTALLIVLSPVYFVLKDRSDAFLCKKNFQAMGSAMLLYASEHDDRLPPAYVTIDDQGTPLIEDGAVYSWANLLDIYMKKDTSFKCPKSSPEDNYLDHHAESNSLMEVSYSFYKPMSCVALSDIPNPDEAILISEGSRRDSFDPHPMLDADGKPLPFDTYVITWSNGNDLPDQTVKSVTHLAYPNTENGVFEFKGASRHPDGNHFLTASGRAISLPPSAAKVEWDVKRKRVIGRWTVPDSYLLKHPGP